jgi:hypothetical protein
VAEQALAVANQRRLHAAKTLGARGNIAMTKLRYLEAVEHFQKAADLVPPGHPDQKGRYLLAEG